MHTGASGADIPAVDNTWSMSMLSSQGSTHRKCTLKESEQCSEKKTKKRKF